MVSRQGIFPKDYVAGSAAFTRLAELFSRRRMQAR
jgi:hypothetical protein